MTEIPEMTDPMGMYWTQPDKSKIIVTDDDATMSRTALRKLREYSCSVPTGTYVGKMWKCKAPNGWYLRWYDEIQGSDITIKSRIIKLTISEKEFLQVISEWAREYLSRRKK